MRMSCNGCRVLRKGCSEDCTIRPCLQWIKSPEAQGNATVFLAKFYGRAGLLNLIGAGPDHLRPAIFRSLLYEACGRMVNPIFGSVGLLWSNNWQLCQAAVEAVLQGAPIIQIPSEKAASIPMPSLKSFDIRHVSKKSDADADASDVHRVAKTSRTAFKRAGSTTSSNNNKNGSSKVMGRQESSVSHEYCGPTSSGGGSMVSVETVEGEPSTPEQQSDEIQLDLTLGLGSTATASTSPPPSSLAPPPLSPMLSAAAAAKRVGLALDLPA